MSALRRHVELSLRLYFRNRMALLYGYLFPIIFLIAFWVLYRYDRVPLVGHVGELLTVTILGGACFGLPTTLVSERERGVWRRYRLAPVPTSTLVAGTLAARYVALVGAGLVQLAIAMALGMPFPERLLELLVAFTAVSFAFLGLGLVIATLADTVPAVQALGQCIFLPMLIIGGVAVKLSSLPDWALHVSAFFPGRYAVHALQSCATGHGLGEAKLSLVALIVIGAAGMITGSKMFRWDAQQRFVARGGKGWLVVALGAWIGMGGLAEAQGHVAAPAASPEPVAALNVSAAPSYNVAPALEPPSLSSDSTVVPQCRSTPISWRAVTLPMIESDALFEAALPPDPGLVTPMVPENSPPEPQLAGEIKKLTRALESWGPAKDGDPGQRVWNLLFVAGTFDIDQLAIERRVPWVVFDQMKREHPKDRLIKILYWIACNPDSLPVPSDEELKALELRGRPGDIRETRHRSAIYAIKLLGRLLGRIR
ncbi:MAG: ABC transporter permease [Deltaproteobacteria bacterium]|nr:ABC transporter permease [Deltaproteobacteria bacterium]